LRVVKTRLQAPTRTHAGPLVTVAAESTRLVAIRTFQIATVSGTCVPLQEVARMKVCASAFCVADLATDQRGIVALLTLGTRMTARAGLPLRSGKSAVTLFKEWCGM
jgi:hypothetical protein